MTSADIVYFRLTFQGKIIDENILTLIFRSDEKDSECIADVPGRVDWCSKSAWNQLISASNIPQ